MSVKGDSGKIKNYFGSCAGIPCAGPVDELVAVILDGRTVWPTDKSWNDGIVAVPVLQTWRVNNKDLYGLADPSVWKKSSSQQKAVLTGFSNTSFNHASPIAAGRHNPYQLFIGGISVAHAGADVALASTTQGSVTKVLHYAVGELVRDGGGVWRCRVAHDATPATRPPNATYWESAAILRASSPNPFPFTIEGMGQCFFYWGTSNQLLDASGEAILSSYGHPPYRHQAVLVIKDFLFGPERQGAPNLEVVTRKKPIQAIVTGAAANLDADFQANPKCAEIELLTDPIFGLGLSPSTLSPTSAQALADQLLALSSKTYLSPLLDSQQSARAFIGAMLAYYDGWLRFNADGALESGRFLHNAAPPAFTSANTIDFHDLIEEIQFDADSWQSTYNEVVVKFQDLQRAWKDAGQTALSTFNRQVVGEPRRATLERPWINREAQANIHAAEWAKVMAQPKIAGSLVVRAEKTASIRQGDLFLLTHDTLQLSIACRCLEKTLAAPPAGRVTLRFENERGIAPLPYQPTPDNPGGTALPAAEAIDTFQLVQPPAGVVSLSAFQDFTISVLAARSLSLTRGLRLWFKLDDASGFYELGEQRAFAVKGLLAQNYPAPASHATVQRSKTGGVATLKVTAHGYSTGFHVAVTGLDGVGYNLDDALITVLDADRFSYLISDGATESPPVADTDGNVTPLPDDDSESLQLDLDGFTPPSDLDHIAATQTEDAINDNALLVWLFQAADPTQFEIATLKAIRLDAGVYKLKVRRARFANIARSFIVADSAWIIYRSELASFTHAKFADYAQAAQAATFRLQSFTAYAETDLSDPELCPDIPFTFSDPYAPLVAWTSLQKNGVEIADLTVAFLPTDTFTFGFQITDPNRDLIEAKLLARLGAIELILWAQTFPPSELQLRTTSFKLPTDGEWEIFCVAKDQSGRVVQHPLRPVGGGAIATLCIISSGSTTVSIPKFSPPSGPVTGFSSGRSVTLSTVTAGATIKYQIRSAGQAPGVTWLTYSGAFLVITSNGPKTVYAYALKAGLTDSPITSANYWYQRS